MKKDVMYDFTVFVVIFLQYYIITILINKFCCGCCRDCCERRINGCEM